MRHLLKLVLILLLALRLAPCLASVSASDVPAHASHSQQQNRLKKPLRQPACLTEEQESLQTGIHLRWPLFKCCLFTTWQAVNDPVQKLKAQAALQTDALLQAFYRLLLFPAHFFR